MCALLPFPSIKQFGHIYTSYGSFLIQPQEEYTIDNQNILHKISREKLPIQLVRTTMDRGQGDGTTIDESLGDDIETIRNDSDGKSYEIELTTSTSSATDESATVAAAAQHNKEDSERESLCDTCENKGKITVFSIRIFRWPMMRPTTTTIYVNIRN